MTQPDPRPASAKAALDQELEREATPAAHTPAGSVRRAARRRRTKAARLARRRQRRS